MDIILIPGLWLDASSWDAITPALERAGHRPHPLTMPGVGSPAAESSAIGIADWVAAATAAIDESDGDVVVVGHSGGGNVAWGAADARADRVARVVFVDTFPPSDGGSIWEFPVVDGVIPFPGWESFEEPEISDLDTVTRERVAAGAKSVPEHVPTDEIRLHDARRLALPVTMLSGTMTRAELQEIIDAAPGWAADLAALTDLEIVELHSGHWPQFSQPDALADAIVAAVR